MPAVIKIEIISSSVDKGLKETVKGLDDLKGAAKNAGGGIDSFREIAVGALRAVGAAAVQVAAAGAQAMGAFVKDSISAAGDFEAGMNSFAAASGAGEAELEAFKDQFLALGKELPVSTAEVQAAAIALVKGGIDPAIVAGGALRDSLLFAAAAGMGLEEAAELTTKMLGTFTSVTATAEEQIAFMAESQELMTKAANASTLDVAKLGDAMLQAAGAAKAGGVSYQDFVTTMGMISPAFGSASEAGTSYKNFLARLIPQTSNATGWMKKLGLYTEETGSVFYDSQGQFIGMREAAEKLKVAFEGSSDAVRNEALAMIFGNDAKGAAMALIDGGAAAYDKFAEKMLNANGIQQQAAATQQGFNFQMENLKGSVEALQIAIGSKLLPILTPLIAGFTQGVNKVMEFVDTFSKLAPAIAENADPFTTFFNVLRISTDDSLNPMINALQNFLVTIGTITGYITGTELPFANMATAIATVSQMFGISAPQAAAFIRTLAGIYDVITTQVIPGVQSFVAFVQGNLTPILAGAAGMILAVAVPAFVAWATAATASAAATIAALAPVVIPIAAIGAAAALLGLAWQQNWGDIQGKTAAAWAVIQPVLTELWTWLSTNIPPAVQKVADFFNTTILPAVTAFAGFVTGTLLPALTNIVLYGLEPVFAAASALAGAISTALQPAIEAASTFLDETFRGVLEILQPILADTSGAVSAVGGAFDAVASAVGGAVSAVKEFLEYAAKVKPPNLGGGGGTAAGAGAAAGKALGGPVMAGEAYMVGERGPELFVPQRAGSIMDAGRTAGQKYVTNNYNYSPNYSATPANPSADFGMMRSLATAGT